MLTYKRYMVLFESLGSVSFVSCFCFCHLKALRRCRLPPLPLGPQHPPGTEPMNPCQEFPMRRLQQPRLLSVQ